MNRAAARLLNQEARTLNDALNDMLALLRNAKRVTARASAKRA